MLGEVYLKGRMIVSNKQKRQKAYHGVLSGLQARIRKNRLGELLVLDGYLSPLELRSALELSKNSGKKLGRVLVEQKLIDPLVIRQTLLEQFALRAVTTVMTLFVSFSSMAVSKSARASSIKDVPARMAFTQAAFSPVNYYPALFGSTEKKSGALKAFTKWTDMFNRFDAALNTSGGQKSMEGFKNALESMRDQPLSRMATQVNELVNRTRYVPDSKNYGMNDYWSTPVEFFARGGDCEDFAIAKYTALRALGVPEERLRVAIVQDLQKNVPHAILIVYTDNGAMILDNQIKTAVNAERVSHYKPIFSINRDAWWLHTKPTTSVTTVASAAR
jgi:predicted transglutaminase-like cysteine proteinase